MERNLESSASDEADFDAMFSGVSLQSFLTLNTTQTLPSSATTASTFPFTFFSEDFPALNLNRSSSATQLGESSSLNYAASESEFKIPKTEPFYYPSDGFLETESTHPFNFLSIPIPIPNHSVLTANSSSSSSSSPFHHLPDLHSLELTQAQQVQVQLYPPLLPQLPSKRVRVDSATHSQQETLDSIVQSCRVMPQSKLARRRRQKLSEKTQSLQRLMPWDTKMDMATMMDEAHKYITFLQAQLKALQTMPPSSSSSSSSSSSPSAHYEFGGLERLTRNQVLRVLLNSRVAQTVLYSKGCCVVSVEQLDLLQKLIFQQQQLVLAPSSSRLFFNH